MGGRGWATGRGGGGGGAAAGGGGAIAGAAAGGAGWAGPAAAAAGGAAGGAGGCAPFTGTSTLGIAACHASVVCSPFIASQPASPPSPRASTA
ncbi:hypothetical protein GAY31_22320 [Azospirillum brasilense]|nr:hypothetical protein [Azospirillum brasilense]